MEPTNEPKKPCFMIAAPMSGSGKTTIARGLMALYASKGMAVQPFKCGPDYIDTKFHASVCGRPSINLDTFMATSEHVCQLFARYRADADISIVEGMMGLFDGYDRDRGSSSEIARLLGLPVVLVVDARSAAYSMAALLSGFIHFREDVHIAGVLFNKVSSARHYKMLTQVCHQLVSLLESHVDWEGLRSLCPTAPISQGAALPRCDTPRLVVARNEESFSFIYQETLDAFQHVVSFDPETEVPSLAEGDLLYLPGGYPEKHLETLTKNEAAMTAIRLFAENGGRVVAECGGMMYLCKSIVDDTGEYPMCGVLPYSITARKQDRKLSLGYRRFMLDGKECRGHEFHYTQFLGMLPESITQVYNAKGEPVDTPLFRYKNVLASYTHLYHLL